MPAARAHRLLAALTLALPAETKREFPVAFVGVVVVAVAVLPAVKVAAVMVPHYAIALRMKGNWR